VTFSQTRQVARYSERDAVPGPIINVPHFLRSVAERAQCGVEEKSGGDSPFFKSQVLICLLAIYIQPQIKKQSDSVELSKGEGHVKETREAVFPSAASRRTGTNSTRLRVGAK
jgi:hypothetical protein